MIFVILRLLFCFRKEKGSVAACDRPEKYIYYTLDSSGITL